MEYEKIRKSEDIFKLIITESQNSHRLTWQIKVYKMTNLEENPKASFNINIHSACEQSAEYLGILFLIFRIIKLKILERVQREKMPTCFLYRGTMRI